MQVWETLGPLSPLKMPPSRSDGSRSRLCWEASFCRNGTPSGTGDDDSQHEDKSRNAREACGSISVSRRWGRRCLGLVGFGGGQPLQPQPHAWILSPRFSLLRGRGDKIQMLPDARHVNVCCDREETKELRIVAATTIG